ncbi:phospho-N-acetylmuramoyl-pentapeptide-transferase [Candidatus Parcubacteria bacterium]|nr:MAG: phospho-N-acetylmuramoyl-pentapeptide-transferase [Candidatus Parcubacteria bacterium]
METLFQIERILVVAFASFILAVAIVPVFTNFMYARQFGKKIRTDQNSPIYQSLHAQKAGTPTMGGVLVWGTVTLLILFFGLISRFWPDSFLAEFNFLSRSQTFLPFGIMVFAGIIGLLDDLVGIIGKGWLGGGIRFRHRFILYGIVASVGAWWFFYKLGWDLIHIPFLGDFNIGLWYIPIFIFIIIASSFSTNQTDGLDGLAGGVLLTAFLSLMVITFVQGRYDLMAFLAAIVGSLLAFLWFNIYPARFFMGDTGSMSMGAVLGVVVMLTNTALILPFFGIILVLEALSTILQLFWRRFLKRKLFLSAPIHHHFEAIGWPEAKITMRFWIISLVFSILGLTIFFLDQLITL